MKCESSFRVELPVYDADGYKMDIVKRPINKIDIYTVTKRAAYKKKILAA